MKLQTLGMAAVGSLFALSLAGCAPQYVTTDEVVGKDNAGNVLFDETIETPGILPDSTYYSYVAGLSAASAGTDAQVVKAATVDFTVTTPEGSWKATDEKLADVYAVGAPDYDIFAVGAPDYASYAVYASPWAEDTDAAAVTK